jgi:hypothetical protein
MTGRTPQVYGQMAEIRRGGSVAHPSPTRFARQVYLPHPPGLFAGSRSRPQLGVAADRHPGGPAVSVVRLQPGAAADRPAVRRIAER